MTGVGLATIQTGFSLNAGIMDAIERKLAQARPLRLEEAPWPERMRILVLAPHPDDFDAIAVTLRYFRKRGDDIWLSVISSSASGVENGFCDHPTAEAKAAIRESEQRTSCRMFGLPDDRIQFLRLPEDGAGDPRDDDENYSTVSANLAAALPDLVCLPHPNDPNPAHRLAFKMLLRHATVCDHTLAALLNRDPKTQEMRTDVVTFFRQEDASWKAELLLCHLSQQRRNLHRRGYGFDERILRTNREAAAGLRADFPFAETFEYRCLTPIREAERR